MEERALAKSIEPVSGRSLDQIVKAINSGPLLKGDLSALRTEVFSAIRDHVRRGTSKGLIAFWHAVERTPALKETLQEGGLQEMRHHPISERVEVLVERESLLSQQLPDYFNKEAYLQGAPQVRVC